MAKRARLTITLPPELKEQVQIEAIRRRMTASEIIEEALKARVIAIRTVPHPEGGA